MRRRNLIIIIAGLLFITPFLGVPNTFQDITISILSLLIIVILLFSKHLEGSLIKPRNSVEFDESLPDIDYEPSIEKEEEYQETETVEQKTND